MSDPSTVAPYLPYLASALAVVLSLLNLYLARRDRVPRLRIRVRYEYRANLSPERPRGDRSGGPAGSPASVHARTQEGLYMRLGDFLKEHGLSYPNDPDAAASPVSPGTPVVRFSVTGLGDREVVLTAVRIVVRAQPLGLPFGLPSLGLPFGRALVVDPKEGRVRPAELAGDTRGNLASSGPVEVAPGGGVGYRFGLVRLAEVLLSAGFSGDVRLALEATDRAGRVHRRPFSVNTDLWAYGFGGGEGGSPTT